MKKLCLLVLFVSITVATSCNKVATVDTKDWTFITGECIASNTLLFDEPQDFSIGWHSGEQMFEIYLRLDLNMDGVWNSKEHWHRKVPNAVVFDQFDSDSALAKDLYNQTWDAIRQSGPWYYPISTVFYEEGLSLTADKPFAGHPAGEELDPLIPFNQNRTDSFKISIPFIDITSHRYLLTTGFTLCLPMGNFEKTEEIVSFNLVLPIKAGMYLTWMIDRQNNSESEMIYRDEVFTCSFTLHNGLR